MAQEKETKGRAEIRSAWGDSWVAQDTTGNPKYAPVIREVLQSDMSVHELVKDLMADGFVVTLKGDDTVVHETFDAEIKAGERL